MHHSQSKVLVLCAHPGNLIEYTRLLNDLGFFCLTLCSDIEDARVRVNYCAGFDILIYDDFRFSAQGRADLKLISEFITHIVLLANVRQNNTSALFRWANLNKIPLLGLLPRPINAYLLNHALSFVHQQSLGKQQPFSLNYVVRHVDAEALAVL